MIRDSDNFTDPRITETEGNGGDSSILATYCSCGTEIDHGATECQDCHNSCENYREELAEDDKLFKD